MLTHMSGLFRFTAIAIGILVFAFVLSVCGDAFACTDGADACCVRTDKLAGLHHIFDRLMRACSRFGLLAGQTVAGDSKLTFLYAAGDQGISSTLLTSKVSQLRI